MANRFQTLIKRLAGISDAKIAPQKQAGYLSFSDGYSFGADISQETYLKSYKSWVYAAVTKRADSFSTLKLTLNKIVKKGGETEIKPVKQHAVLELLDRVNPFLSWPDLLKIYQTYKDLAGNTYWWLIKSGNTITEIWPYLRPDRMSVIPSANTFIAGYNYLVPDRGEYVKFDTDEIIHFKYPNPLDPYHGVSPMEASYLAFNTYMRSSEWNNRFFGNNARADFLLMFPDGLSETEQKQIRAQWESQHRGAGHEHKFGILSGDAKVQNIGMSSKDMEFIEQMKFTRDEILAIFKVPKALLDPQELNYASAQVAKEVFMEEVVVPLMKDFVTTLNEFLLPHYNDDSLFFDFESPMNENPETKRLRYQTLSSVGAIAPNEIREAEGLPPFEGGNSIFLPFSMQPIGEQVDMNQGKMAIGTVKDIHLPKKYNVSIKSKSVMADIKAEVKKGIEKELKEKPLENKAVEKKIKVMPPEVKKKSEKELFGEMMWQAKIVKTNSDERNMQRDLRKQFARQEKQVLRSLSEKSFTFKFNEEKETGIFIEAFTPFYEEILKAYGDDALDMVGMSGFSLNARAKKWLEENVREFAQSVNTTTKDKITAVLVKAVEEGQGINEAAKGVKQVFEEASTSRAKMIARTEISSASNFATVEGWKQSDVVEQKEWFTALDERADDVCLGLHGKVVNLDDTFGTSDDVFGDVQEPPAHINCRCRLLPVQKTKSAMIAELKTEKEKLEKTVADIKEQGNREIEEIKGIKEKLTKVLENGQE